MMISQRNPQALKNPWVLALIAFLFVFLTANAIFIYLAFASPPHLVVDDFYEHGKNYDKVLQRIEKEKALGWSGTLLLPSQTRVHQKQHYEALIQGAQSVALSLDSVVLNLYRPSDAEADFSIEMTKKRPGVYGADIEFPLPGIWDVIIIATQGEQEFLITKRVTIAP